MNLARCIIYSLLTTDCTRVGYCENICTGSVDEWQLSCTCVISKVVGTLAYMYACSCSKYGYNSLALL